MEPTVTVRCIECRHRETVPLTEDRPSCSSCGGVVIPEAVQGSPAELLADDHSASRRVDVLEREAPHLLAPSSLPGEVAPIAWPEEEA